MSVAHYVISDIPDISPSPKQGERVTGRLVVRRIPDLNTHAGAGQPTIFPTYRFHAWIFRLDVPAVVFLTGVAIWMVPTTMIMRRGPVGLLNASVVTAGIPCWSWRYPSSRSPHRVGRG